MSRKERSVRTKVLTGRSFRKGKLQFCHRSGKLRTTEKNYHEAQAKNIPEERIRGSSSEEERRVNALVSGAEEGRDKLR